MKSSGDEVKRWWSQVVMMSSGNEVKRWWSHREHMAVMIGGPAANLCLLGCLFVVVVNTGTVPRKKKLLTVCRLFMFVGVSVSEFPPSPSIPPLSFSLSRTTNKQTHIQTDKYRCTAVCTPLFMCTSVYACKKKTSTTVYTCTKQVHVYRCLCVQKTSTSVPQQLRESPSPSNCWTRAQR